MLRVVISDSSTLILFQKINQFELLKQVYGSLLTTHEIAKEFGDPLPDWIEMHSPTDKKYQEYLETQLDIGEASAIALAAQFDDALLIFDDLKARKLAVKLKFKITGALGIINRAKQMGVIPKVKPIIDKLLETDFRISKKIVDEILRINDES